MSVYWQLEAIFNAIFCLYCTILICIFPSIYLVYNENLALSSLNLACVNEIMGIFQFVLWDSH